MKLGPIAIVPLMKLATGEVGKCRLYFETSVSGNKDRNSENDPCVAKGRISVRQ
jgi:hypothetical protein